MEFLNKYFAVSFISIQHDQQTRSLALSTPQCAVHCRRPVRGIAIIEIRGKDSGGVYQALFNALEPDLVSEAPVGLFVDSTQASGSAINIVEWANFLRADHGLFRCIHVLTASSLVLLSAKIVKHLSHTGGLMQIHTDPNSFNARLQQMLTVARAA